MLADPEISRVFLPGDTPVKAGERVRNGAYADTLRAVVREGPALLYGGALGARLADDMRRHEAFLAESDLIAYRTQRLAVLRTAFGAVAHILLVTWGIHWSTPFSSALIMACGPVSTLLLLWLLRGRRIGRGQALGVAAALAGVLLVMSDKLLGADWRAGGGDLMMLVATLVFSLYTIWVTPLVQRHGGPEVVCWCTLLAAPPMLLLNAPAAAAAAMAAGV